MSFASVSGVIDRWWQRCQDKQRGITPEQRLWIDWAEQNINIRADTVQRVYEKFKYVIEVDSKLFFSHEEMGAWIPVPEFRQFTHPTRCLGENAVWNWFRGGWSQQPWSPGFHINEMYGGDHVFVATNSEQDALWIAMKWGK